MSYIIKVNYWLKAEREKAEVLYDDFNIANVQTKKYHNHALRGMKLYVIIKKQFEVIDMDLANKIKELRESTGMSRKEFSEHTGIPVRTLEDWETARRTPPEYIPRLIAYQLKFEQLKKKTDT